MIIPVLCFTCGKTLGDKWDWYEEEVQKLIKQQQENADKVKKTTKKEKELEPSLQYFEDRKSVV